MSAQLGNAPLRHNRDAVGVLDGGQPVGDNHGRVLVDLVQAVQCLLDNLSRHDVVRGGGGSRGDTNNSQLI